MNFEYRTKSIRVEALQEFLTKNSRKDLNSTIEKSLKLCRTTSSFGTLRLFPTFVVLPRPMVMTARAMTKSAPRRAISFPKHIYHSIICIGALIAHRDNEHCVVDALGAPHIGDRSEGELITSFVNRIAELSPQLVTFNGSSIDLPILRYRAMMHKVPASGLSMRPYFNRYTEDAIDLCDLLSSFNSQGKAKLHEGRLLSPNTKSTIARTFWPGQFYTLLPVGNPVKTKRFLNSASDCLSSRLLIT